MLIKTNKNPSPKDLREFGWTLVVGFGVLGGLLFWKGKSHVAFGLWGIGVPLGILALLNSFSAKALYRLWVGWAFVMGTVMTRVILSLLFFVVITPVAILFRLFGKDVLRLKRDPRASSYWADHRKIADRTYYERLF